MSPRPRLSVVVPHAGREVGPAECLRSLREQTLPAASYEIILVADGCEPSRALLNAARESGARLLKKPKTGVCQTRNAGIIAAAADLVVLLDDDCVAAKNLLEEYERYFAAHPELAGVGGTISAFPQPGMVAAYAEYRGLLSKPVMEGGRILTIITANCCFRRQVLLEVGLFEPRLDLIFRGCGGEDADLSFKLRAARFQLGYCPSAAALHRHRNTARSFVAQQVRNGEGLAAHARLRGFSLHILGLPDPNPGDLVRYLSRFLVSGHPVSGESLLSRIRRYGCDPRLGVRKRLSFALLDFVRRCCCIFGIWRSSRRRGLRALGTPDPNFRESDEKNPADLQRAQ